jgi:hypothetical protein
MQLKEKNKGMWNEDAKDIRPLCNLYLRKVKCEKEMTEQNAIWNGWVQYMT